jgi:hypothetical protein
MLLIFLFVTAVGIFAAVLYTVMRLIFAFENGNGYPGLEDVAALEFEKIR